MNRIPLFFAAVLLRLPEFSAAFSTSCFNLLRLHSRTLIPSPEGGAVVSLKGKQTDEDFDVNDFPPNFGSDDGESQMTGYIADFLGKGNKQEDRFTHMIGIPLEDAHDFMLELEAVQRGILYHCPCLAHACIVPVVTRMPLLYVDASGSNSHVVTKELEGLVKELVQERIFVTSADDSDDDDDDDNDASEETEEKREDETAANKDGYRPLLLNFQGLELEGDANEVLFTIAKENEGTALLRGLVDKLREKVESNFGWKTLIPPDEARDANSNEEWRLRVPFMRLPRDFRDFLPPLDEEGEMDEIINKDGTIKTRDPEQGGNGISPIFFYKWWEDEFSKNTRIRDIGVYKRRTGQPGLTESAFYIPHVKVSLPEGNDKLSKIEAEHQAYHDERFFGEEVSNYSVSVNDDPVKKAKLENYRAKLESTFEMSSVDPESPVASSKTAPENDTDEDHMEEKLRKVVDDRTRNQNLQVPQRKELPSLEDNPIFKQFREEQDAQPMEELEPLPPFPSSEHFVGLWRVVSSPMGMAENVPENESASENLILRVDGTIAGGPVLDANTNHKAAGGSWNFFRAIRKGDESGEEKIRLRISLLIPPHKERAMIMEGEVGRITMPTREIMASNTFSIPELEERKEKANVESSPEGLMHCGGQVWTEDAKSGNNREMVGTFSLMKLKKYDPNNLVVTVAGPVRNLD